MMRRVDPMDRLGALFDFHETLVAPHVGAAVAARSDQTADRPHRGISRARARAGRAARVGFAFVTLTRAFWQALCSRNPHILWVPRGYYSTGQKYGARFATCLLESRRKSTAVLKKRRKCTSASLHE